MPAPFSPVHIPFVSGVRQDIGKLAQENPAQLLTATNAVFTRKGHISGRPGAVARDAQVQVSAGTPLLAGLTNVNAGASLTGIVSTGFGVAGSTTNETPLLCYQGKSYFNRANLWEFAGTHWSLRQTKSVALASVNTFVSAISAPNMSVGKDVVATMVDIANPDGVPFLNATGEIKYRATGGTIVSGSVQSVFAAGQNVFWSDPSATAVWGMFTTADGPTTSAPGVLGFPATLAANSDMDVATDGTFYYVLFGSPTSGSNTSTLLKVDSAGAVLQSLALTWAAGAMNAGRGISICYDPASNRLGLAGIVHATGAVGTKVITLVSGVMADAGIDLTLTGTAGVATREEVVRCGVTHNGSMSVVFTKSPARWDTGATSTKTTGSVYVGGRLFAAATQTAFTTLLGAVNSFGIGLNWYPLFAGQTLAGRTVVGFMCGLDGATISNQWVVMDFTDLYGSGNTAQRIAVAAGASNGLAFMRPGSVFCDGTRLSFGVLEGAAFSRVPDTSPATGIGNVPTVTRGILRRISLETQAVQAAHVSGVTLLSGQLLHTFDGVKIRPHHFVEETPYIFNGGNGFVYTSAVAGGLTPGSYSYQVTWEVVNKRGQICRSGASNILTVPGVAAAQQVTFHVTIPQVWNIPTTDERVVIRAWATQANPVANSPKYLIGEGLTSDSLTGYDLVFTHSKTSVGTEEQLYATTDTLDDMRAPGADRGVAYANERAWIADQTSLYASKILRSNIAPSWNTEGPNVLSVPASLGTIQGLAALVQQNALVVVCSRGVAVVTGPGFDDTGAGPGWVLQTLDGALGAGEGTPRGLVATPAGVAYQAQDGNLWLAAPGTVPTPLSRQIRNEATSTSVVDVVLVPSTSTTNAMLVANGASMLRVFDLESGQWSTWSLSALSPANGKYMAAINGALWLQLSASPLVCSVDGAQGSDLGQPYSALIETGTLKPANPSVHGWGRLRAVVLNEVRAFGAASSAVTVTVLADQNDRTLLSKSRSTSPEDASAFRGGTDGALEFRTTVQRCSYFRVLLQFNPAIFDAEGVDLWVSNTGESAPLINRS